MLLDKLTPELMTNGQIIRKPVGEGKGYWVGAPGVFYEPSTSEFYLTYRVRRPRGVHPDRGGEARIARSADGVNFEDVFLLTKEHLLTTSIERCALIHGVDGVWRYFVSFVDPTDHRWCVGVIKARSIEGLDPNNIEPVLSASDIGLEGVKDPFIVERHGRYHMILSVAVATDDTTEKSHTTADIYNTGECRSATGVAISASLDKWSWKNLVFAPRFDGWDSYAARISSVLHDGAKYYGLYDGSASHMENYEERTGIVESKDLMTWERVPPETPLLESPHASGSLRYTDMKLVDDKLFVYYEFARADGSHDLRVVTINAGDSDD